MCKIVRVCVFIFYFKRPISILSRHSFIWGGVWAWANGWLRNVTILSTKRKVCALFRCVCEIAKILGYADRFRFAVGELLENDCKFELLFYLKIFIDTLKHSDTTI